MSDGSVDHPAGWGQAELGQVARWGSGGTPKAGTASFYDGEIPWAVIGDLTDGVVSTTATSITEDGLAGSSAKLVEPGTVLVAMYGSIGKLGIAGVQMATNQAIAFAVPDESLLIPSFLFHYLRSQREQLSRAGKGATQQNISQTILKAWPVPLPSLQEQERIVEVLEEHLSHLDAALASIQTIRDKAAQFRRSLLHAAFTTGVGGISSESWPKVALDEVADVRLGRQRSPKNHTGTLMRPYLRAANVTWGGLALDDVKEMNFTDAEMETFRLEPGDVLVNEASGSPAEVGKAAVFRGEISECAFQNTLLRVRPTDRTTTQYLHHFLVYLARTGAHLEDARGVGIAHLGRAKLAARPVPVPSLEEQERIVEVLEEHLSRIDATLAAADRVEAQCAALRRSLLHAAFTGKLTEGWRETAHV